MELWYAKFTTVKVLILLFFVFTFPIVIFLFTLFYGGLTTTVLKEALEKSNAYTKIGSLVDKLGSEEGDPTTQEFVSILKNRITPSYIRSKTEETLDSASGWITGSTSTPPIVSFKEIKEDIVKQNPELLSTLDSMSKDMENQPENSDMDADSNAQMKQATAELSKLSKSDFTFPLEKQLAGVKYAYSFFRIVLFVETGLIALSILGLMLLSHGIKSKFRWIAATLAITGIWGFVLIALNNITLSIATGVANNVQNEAASVVGPIVIALLSKLFSAYTTNQGVMSIAMFLVAAVFLTVGELTNKSVIVKSIPKKVSNIKKK